MFCNLILEKVNTGLSINYFVRENGRDLTCTIYDVLLISWLRNNNIFNLTK